MEKYDVNLSSKLGDGSRKKRIRRKYSEDVDSSTLDHSYPSTPVTLIDVPVDDLK